MFLALSKERVVSLPSVNAGEFLQPSKVPAAVGWGPFKRNRGIGCRCRRFCLSFCEEMRYLTAADPACGYSGESFWKDLGLFMPLEGEGSWTGEGLHLEAAGGDHKGSCCDQSSDVRGWKRSFGVARGVISYWWKAAEHPPSFVWPWWSPALWGAVLRIPGHWR